MRNEVLDFAFGFVPMAVTGLALAIAGGRMTAVYCGTLTPVPPTAAPFSGFDPGAPCISSAWVPYWPGLYFVAAGAVLGLVLLAVETPLPRRRGEGAGGPGLPARDPSTTTHLLGGKAWSRGPETRRQPRRSLVLARPRVMSVPVFNFGVDCLWGFCVWSHLTE